MTNAIQLRCAHSALTEALRLLDEAAAPADIGAHVDLAVHRLQDVIQLGQRPMAAVH